MEVDAEVMQTYPCFHCIEKDKRIADLKNDIDQYREIDQDHLKRIFALEATIKRGYIKRLRKQAAEELK